MENSNEILKAVIEIPADEAGPFSTLVKEYRKKNIRGSVAVVKEVFSENDLEETLKNQKISEAIRLCREEAWQKFLIEEANFNATVLKDLRIKFSTPQSILDELVEKNILGKTGTDLLEAVKDTCGEYAGRITPYVYALSLSNTQSRRSRSGKTFEAIIYTLYEKLGYPFDSQGKVGKEMFQSAGLGKKVDSVLPSIEAFMQRRNKVVIGTMKTSLRERWQEVAEEISRTNIPVIHLLTADEDISVSKAKEMANHNIVIVAYKDIAEKAGLKNIISFEEYFFTEIPQYLSYWN